MLFRRISLAPEISEVSRLNDWLDQAFAESAAPTEACADLKLCLNEAVTNTILYGYADQPAPKLDIEIKLDGRAAAALVTDNGIAFDPLDHPGREKPTDLETAEIGGFGVQLIRQTADIVEYQRSGGENRLRIVCGDPLPSVPASRASR